MVLVRIALGERFGGLGATRGAQSSAALRRSSEGSWARARRPPVCSRWLVGEGGSPRAGTVPGVTDELEALQWLTVDELAAGRRRAIKQLNLLDRSAVELMEPEAALQRTLALIGLVQDERRHR